MICKGCGEDKKAYLYSDKSWTFTNRIVVVACSEECANKIPILKGGTGSDNLVLSGKED